MSEWKAPIEKERRRWWQGTPRKTNKTLTTFLMIVALLLLFLLIQTDDITFGTSESAKIWVYSVLPGILVAGLVMRRSSQSWFRNNTRRVDYVVSFILMSIVVLLAGAALAFIPYLGFNVYNIHYVAAKNPVVYYRCPIIRVEWRRFGKSGHRWETDFILNGHNETMKWTDDELKPIAKTPALSRYELVLGLRSGLMGTYVLDSWSVRHR